MMVSLSFGVLFYYIPKPVYEGREHTTRHDLCCDRACRVVMCRAAVLQPSIVGQGRRHACACALGLRCGDAGPPATCVEFFAAWRITPAASEHAFLKS